MFYLSRAEQVALFVLTVLLLAGAGVLTYARGQHSVDAAADQPVFVPAPTKVVASVPIQASGGDAGVPAADAAPPVAPTPIADRTPAPHTPSKQRSSGRAASVVRRPAGPISLNAASEKDLDILPGIGPVFAQRIVAYREQRKRDGHRGFESKDELLNVPGIGPKRYAAIRDLVTL